MSRYRNEQNNLRRHVQQKTNLYVKNFDQEMTESDLCKLFSNYGTITSCKVSK